MFGYGPKYNPSKKKSNRKYILVYNTNGEKKHKLKPESSIKVNNQIQMILY